MNLFVWIYFSGLSAVDSLVAGNAPLVVQLTDDNTIDTCQLRQTIVHFNTVMGSEWWSRINPQLSLVIMNRDDISSSFSRGMAIAGMSEFFTITCNGMTRKSMAVLVWNQLDMIDPRHGVSFQLHRYASSTLYTQQQPVHQLRLIREVLNQSRNNLSAIFKEKFELNVASMQLPSTDRQRIGPILVEAKVLYAAEKCQRSIGDKLTVNSARDEYYVYCLIMIFMTMVSLIITTRCYIMEIMNENVQTASQDDDDDDLVLRYPDNFDEYGQQKLHESLQTLGAHIRRRLHGQLLETEPEEVAGVTFDIYNQPSTAPEHQCNGRKSSKISMYSQQQEQSRRTSTTNTEAMARALQPGGHVPHRRQRGAKKAKINTLQRFTE